MEITRCVGDRASPDSVSLHPGYVPRHAGIATSGLIVIASDRRERGDPVMATCRRWWSPITAVPPMFLGTSWNLV